MWQGRFGLASARIRSRPPDDPMPELDPDPSWVDVELRK